LQATFGRRPGMANHSGSHAEFYPRFPRLRRE
jgi:hypothetical protein